MTSYLFGAGSFVYPGAGVMPAPMTIGAVMWRCPDCPVIVLDLSRVGAHVWSHNDPVQVAARDELLVEARARLAAYDERKKHD